MSVPRICLFVFLFFCSLATAFSQKRKSAILQYDTAARAGAIVLMDGTRIRGRLVFNDNDGIVTLYDETSDGLRAFTSRSVVKFQMAGAEGGRDKVYYSLEFEDPDTGIKNPEFFEVLKELDSFIVLVKIERLKTEARRGLLQPKQSPLP